VHSFWLGLQHDCLYDLGLGTLLDGKIVQGNGES
jgi:hypothetical protein